MGKNYDFIIIGQGITGSVLSWRLIEKNLSFLVINNSIKKSSSNSALGLYNPITGKNFVETWNSNQIINETENFYASIENKLNEKFLYKKKIYRPFSSKEDSNNWELKIGSKTYRKYIQKIHYKSKYKFLKDNIGGVITNKSGYLNVKKFLLLTRKYLKSKNIYIENDVKSKNIKSRKDYIEIIKKKTKYLIFCRGFYENESNFFSWLPFNLVKGENMNIFMSHKIKEIIQKSILIIPNENNIYSVGSTYDWKILNDKVSETGINKLKNKIEKILNCKYKIIEKKAGIRPATKDRRPFVGFHPSNKKIGIINGLGSKGISLAPYCTKILIDNIFNNKNINKEINIKRYISLY